MSIIREVWPQLIVAFVFITSVKSYSSDDLVSKIDENIKIEESNSLIKDVNNEQSLNYRLPNNSIPTKYDLWISTDVHKGSLNFNGNVKIHVKIIEASFTVTLHSRDLNIQKVDITDKNENLVQRSLEFEYNLDKEFIIIRLPSIYAVNSEFILDISYNSTLKNKNEMSGFFLTEYYDQNFTKVWVASTHFLPSNARKAFVCYDEPKFRAPIRLQIQHDISYHAISNMPVSLINTSNGTGYKITIFEESPPIQTYLLSFVVSNLEFIANKNDKDLEQRIYGEPLKINNGAAEFANEIITNLLRKFKEILSVDIGISRINHVQIPQMYGALEHYGLIAYEENFLLLDPNYNEDVKEYFKPQIIVILAHGLIHQYFGGLVSPNWWQYLWLSEGISMFYQFYIPSLIYPEYNFMQIFQDEVLNVAFSTDIGNETMNDYVESPDEIQNKFNLITFEKSAAIVRMFHEALSPSTFTRGLLIFLNDMRFKAASSADLHKALQTAVDAENLRSYVNISAAMSTWETQAGYPVIIVQKSGNNLILTQKRFPSDDINNNDNIYSIPITFATKTNPNFNKTIADLWMTTRSLTMNETLRTSDEWIIFNIQQVGFYRVDYSRELWDAIIKEYKRNFKIIHHTNRKVLHEEMFIAWKVLKTKTARDCLAFLSVLEYEESGYVWEKASQYMDPLNDFLAFSNEYKYFEDVMHKILMPHLNKLTEHSKLGTEESELSIEVKKWSRITQHPEYLRQELAKLIRYMDDEDSSDPELCSALRYANASLYRHFLNKTLNFDRIYDIELANSLGCTMNRSLLNELFAGLLNPLNKASMYSDLVISTIYTTIESSVVGLETVMDLTVSNWWELSQL